MTVSQKDVARFLEEYDLDDLTIATLCSHTSLQIFHGARLEGFRTLGIGLRGRLRFYDAFPKGKPDEFMEVDSYSEVEDLADELREHNAIIVPHGSFVQYVGAERFLDLAVPTFGNRRVLQWESDRDMERRWLESAGITMPKEYHHIDEVDRPVIVKFGGARGGRGFFVAKDAKELARRLSTEEKYTIQEFVLGTRFYLHYFYSPISTQGYALSRGTLELLSIDRRIESNVDEIYKLGTPSEIESLGVPITYVVTGNLPVVIRESLLPKVFSIGEAVVERSLELFGGVIGPFSLETVCTDTLDFVVFEISARIVAGTNPFITTSPYSDLIYERMSTGRRIAREIRLARDSGRLLEVLS
ncbi:formate--phosphoribosylaminoimidazolecarboxamide ligase [Methermicoccus shengliensis]|uniref:5-formaminoimidazole-4-carboxamide-1-(beta)-D-ribofuranosyl 5'-monophosphate synthetase n=1 Tax=Methermicoccus shengliensis TaxID=660064 RepID=A0A832RYZ7_9EURY|nr:formate--phosphoribosylaminoimidazolecarboxamide ligase [Methermicoccus shengliensis]KUK04022.1 MAG: 5-formaminoimidazole-4-carboxamide-1-(beta)-D-ribofuranosyl 5'-monophosphate synthetase [Euryarchaeota archaeon 55_53]KUK29745.1 MAG: 5-formaminoimidazole-4-carboxamide-1-(beta)-D-ribofuranosyl 5'-monophosphate synthetase [Methanosarcinales archeaon 56_1174]MDI3488541.1 5-formaminoimidazole-4-carboxamide-(beta)-D-ribofuranosyl 5-monophosphate synthetase [Methanosarcinales archaeon]MDN5295862.